jgi:hypothetical protein
MNLVGARPCYKNKKGKRLNRFPFFVDLEKVLFTGKLEIERNFCAAAHFHFLIHKS